MKKRLAILLLAAGILTGAAAAGSAAASARPSISIAEFGHYRTHKSGDAIIEPRTAAGLVTELSRWNLVERTTVIFGQLGRDFGVEIDLSGFAEGPVLLTVRTLHPPLTNPGTGRTSRISEHQWEGETRRKVYFGYTFSHLWELAEGEWVKQFFYRGRLLAQQRFRVVIPMY